MKTKYTRVWEIDGTLVVADTIEDAVALYRKSYKYDHNYVCMDIDSVEIVKTHGGNIMAILSVGEPVEKINVNEYVPI